MNKKATLDNGQQLRKLIERSRITLQEALDLMNEGQAFPITMSALKSYLSGVDSSRRRNCPDAVINRAREVILPAKK
ncbi:hypothetical protein [Ralstonia sp. ASV6]|uniref:hypothetical protein n=1 Tax=Ralstonia sp. ASV6 TaxID=2795124 RepID=UPI0018EE07B5|nr:hypothetical protein [Ralstonia sp. ASV6]